MEIKVELSVVFMVLAILMIVSAALLYKFSNNKVAKAFGCFGAVLAEIGWITIAWLLFETGYNKPKYRDEIWVLGIMTLFVIIAYGFEVYKEIKHGKYNESNQHQ